jgi:hypothetical protein
MPVPSSTIVEDWFRSVVVQRGFVGEVIHSAKRGVIFHKTILFG